MTTLRSGKIAPGYLKAAVSGEGDAPLIGERSAHIFIANEDCASIFADEPIHQVRKRRGPKGEKTNRIADLMFQELSTCKFAKCELQNEKEIVLAERYKASRDTVRKALSLAIKMYEEQNKC